MRARSWIGVVVAVALAPMAATGQTSSGMVADFKAYRAAYEAGDLEAAERHAKAALEASEAQASSKRAVLAINLATVQNDLGNFAEAKATADRASGYIAAGAEGDARLAQLLAARASLELEEGKAARTVEKLLEQIGAPDAQLAEATYQAGIALAKQGMSEGNYSRAKVGYGAALAATELDAEDGIIPRILALTGLGAAELAVRNFEQSSIHLNDAVALATPPGAGDRRTRSFGGRTGVRSSLGLARGAHRRRGGRACADRIAHRERPAA